MNLKINYEQLFILAEELEAYRSKINNIQDKFKTSNINLDWELGNTEKSLSEKLKQIESKLQLLSVAFLEHANYIWDVRYDFKARENRQIKAIEEILLQQNTQISRPIISGSFERSVSKIMNLPLIGGTKLPNLNLLTQAETAYGVTLDRDVVVVEHWIDAEANIDEE